MATFDFKFVWIKCLHQYQTRQTINNIYAFIN